MTRLLPIKHRKECWAGCSCCSFASQQGQSRSINDNKNTPYDSFVWWIDHKVIKCFIYMTWHAIYKYTWRWMRFERCGEDYQWIKLSSICFMNYIYGAFGFFEGLTFSDHHTLSLFRKEWYQHFAKLFLLCSTEHIKSDGFGLTWRWVNY